MYKQSDAIIDLSDEQVEAIEANLEAYDDKHMPPRLSGSVRIGCRGGKRNTSRRCIRLYDGLLDFLCFNGGRG